MLCIKACKQYNIAVVYSVPRRMSVLIGHEDHLDSLTALVNVPPVQQALLHRHPVPEALLGNDLVDSFCQVDVAGDVGQALQLGCKVLQLCQAPLSTFGPLQANWSLFTDSLMLRDAESQRP